jgi:hypothetical protein
LALGKICTELDPDRGEKYFADPCRSGSETLVVFPVTVSLPHGNILKFNVLSKAARIQIVFTLNDFKVLFVIVGCLLPV